MSLNKVHLTVNVRFFMLAANIHWKDMEKARKWQTPVTYTAVKFVFHAWPFPFSFWHFSRLFTHVFALLPSLLMFPIHYFTFLGSSTYVFCVPKYFYSWHNHFKLHSFQRGPTAVTIFQESVVRVKINSLHKLETYDLFFTAFLILAPVRQHGHVVAVDTSSK